MGERKQEGVGDDAGCRQDVVGAEATLLLHSGGLDEEEQAAGSRKRRSLGSGVRAGGYQKKRLSRLERKLGCCAAVNPRHLEPRADAASDAGPW